MQFNLGIVILSYNITLFTLPCSLFHFAGKMIAISSHILLCNMTELMLIKIARQCNEHVHFACNFINGIDEHDGLQSEQREVHC